ncbi:MAG: hypothetical protein AAF705_20015 [Bacteroidota bacterium]
MRLTSLIICLIVGSLSNAQDCFRQLDICSDGAPLMFQVVAN